MKKKKKKKEEEEKCVINNTNNKINENYYTIKCIKYKDYEENKQNKDNEEDSSIDSGDIKNINDEDMANIIEDVVNILNIHTKHKFNCDNINNNENNFVIDKKYIDNCINDDESNNIDEFIIDDECITDDDDDDECVNIAYTYNKNQFKKYNDLLYYQQHIRKFSHLLMTPPVNIKYNNIPTDSCYNFRSNVCNHPPHLDDPDFNKFKPIPAATKISKRIKMYPTKKQEKILDNWFNAYIKMYNYTIKYIKSRLNFDKLRNLKELHKPLFKDKIKPLMDLIEKNKQNNKIRNKLIKKINPNAIKSKSNAKTQTETKIKKSEIARTKRSISTYHSNLEQLQDINKNNKANNILIAKLQCDPDILIYKQSRKRIYKTFNFYNVRSSLKNKRDDIVKNSGSGNNDYIRVHVLDTAIRKACDTFDSCVTKYIRGSQKRFRIRYWRYDRTKKMLEIETGFIKNGVIFNKVLGKMKYKYQENKKERKVTEKDDDEITEDKNDYVINPKGAVFIYYDSITKKYTLAETVLVTEGKTANVDEYIGIDPGIRTFLTCLTKDKILKFGTNIGNKIQRILLIIDKLNAKKDKNINLEYKEKIRLKIHKYQLKIDNMVDDMHWKVIKHLTTKYKKIMIGDFDVSAASKNGKSKISAMMKRLGYALAHGKFRERLKYKCGVRSIEMVIVNEKYTSKVCSKCGYCKNDLGRAKVFECDDCETNIDRDVNGCRGILIKNIKEEKEEKGASDRVC